MAFSPDSSLAAKVVESPSSEVGPRPVSAIRAIVIHMAEGGGTVPWLTRPDGNSSHYVVEYSGRLVQMVREKNWAGSINPHAVRTNNDVPYIYLNEKITYGYSANRAALGDGWDNPNYHVIAIEVEGFAKDGPNAAQSDKLMDLVADIRRRYGKPLPTLGHRDFQNYKACPGKLIRWADYGGHGNPTNIIPEEEPVGLAFYPTTPVNGTVTIKPERGLINLTTEEIIFPDDRVKNTATRIHLIEPQGEGEGRQDGFLVRHNNAAYIALDDVVESFTVNPIKDCSQIESLLADREADLAAIAKIATGG